jgi:aryl-alcohol dehydrogenase-like predicted oxidoreductase
LVICLDLQNCLSATLIDVRRLDQLDGNLEVLNVQLSPEEIDSLNKLSEPPATFTSRMATNANIIA